MAEKLDPKEMVSFEKPLMSNVFEPMFEAAQTRGLPIAGSDVLYLDVPRGKQYKGARMGSRMKKNIEAACKNISAIWDTI